MDMSQIAITNTGLRSYGLCSYGLYSYDLYSYGLSSYGRYVHGLYDYGMYRYGILTHRYQEKMAAPQAVFEAILNYGAASASRNASLCATSADRAEATVCTTTEMTIATLKKTWAVPV